MGTEVLQLGINFLRAQDLRKDASISSEREAEFTDGERSWEKREGGRVFNASTPLVAAVAGAPSEMSQEGPLTMSFHGSHYARMLLHV